MVGAAPCTGPGLTGGDGTLWWDLHLPEDQDHNNGMGGPASHLGTGLIGAYGTRTSWWEWDHAQDHLQDRSEWWH